MDTQWRSKCLNIGALVSSLAKLNWFWGNLRVRFQVVAKNIYICIYSFKFEFLKIYIWFCFKNTSLKYNFYFPLENNIRRVLGGKYFKTKIRRNIFFSQNLTELVIVWIQWIYIKTKCWNRVKCLFHLLTFHLINPHLTCLSIPSPFNIVCILQFFVLFKYPFFLFSLFPFFPFFPLII